ncbi:ADH3-alcohol dehydrogenase III [Fusarium pseudoanthophilum]|uniref:ADH3-alcohol dehydrogenase III n=1 Tax=Fusarium pseudoanthophilum TaxID=48495 RepID=A0A8H5PP91_9HYPO|nr:ADH3-alcohol dehydrogenase III [Fusarium pseudoanthophilum]
MAIRVPEIPKQYRAVVYDNPGSISTKIVTLDTPEPGPGEVLINMTHSGVCHSDLAVMTNGWTSLPAPTPKDQVGGHEGVGKVVKLGPGVEATGIKIGDRVGIKWIANCCGRCEPCIVREDGLCFNQQISGYFTPGTFQQYVLGTAAYVTPIPEGLDSAIAAPMLCAGVTVYAALLRSQAKAGDWVVIAGAGGGLGHLACQLGSRALGLRIIGVDDSSKAGIVYSSGAEHFVDVRDFSSDEEMTTKIKSLTGGLGAHAVIVCTASPRAYAQSMSFLRFNGTVVCVGMVEGDEVPIAGAKPVQMIAQQLRVVGSAVGNQQHAIEVLDFAARGIIKPHVEVRKMEDLTGVFEDMKQGKLQGRVVIDLA